MSCLFISIGKWTSESPASVRKKICDYLEEHQETGFDCIPLFQMLDTYEESAATEKKQQIVSTYINNMRKSSTWGGAVEIRAAAEVYQTPITVFSVRGVDHHLFINGGLVFSPSSYPKETSPIKISWNGSHYEALNS